MNENNRKTLLVVAIIFLICIELIIFLPLSQTLFGLPSEPYLIIFGNCCFGIFLLAAVFFVVFLYLVMTKVITEKILWIIIVILIVILVILLLLTFFYTPTAAMTGTIIYSRNGDDPGTNMNFQGTYVTWLRNRIVYFLDLSWMNQTPIAIGSASSGPLLANDTIFYMYNNTLYRYTLSFALE